MMEHLADVLNWIGRHAAWAGPVVFLVALTESLALVGLIVPGAFLMFGVGALIGSGRLEYWPIMLWAVAGAIVGDGVSYLLGRLLGPRLRQVWPFSRKPELLDRAIEFFNAHGGKSVVLGRFVGPLRPIIPAVAGMLHMPAGRFVVVNVLSAFFWAPAYLLPGLVLVASLAMAGAMVGRLVVLGLIVAVIVWAAGMALQKLSRKAMPADPRHRRLVWAGAVISGLLLSVALAATLGLWSQSAPTASITWAQWQQRPWELVSTRRNGVWNTQETFDLQVAAHPVELARALVDGSWQLPEAFDVQGALLWLSPEPDLARVPPLPHRHDGRAPDRIYVRPQQGGRLVLWVWHSGYALGASGRPIWLVSVERESLSSGWPWLRRQEQSVPAEEIEQLKARLSQQLPRGHVVGRPRDEPSIAN